MLQWILGEKRYISITVSEASSESFTIASATYTIFDVNELTLMLPPYLTFLFFLPV